jgi:hypothetical protein
VQKCFTPSITQSWSSDRIVVSMRNVRDRLTAGSLPQLPNSLPWRTTSAK